MLGRQLFPAGSVLHWRDGHSAWQAGGCPARVSTCTTTQPFLFCCPAGFWAHLMRGGAGVLRRLRAMQAQRLRRAGPLRHRQLQGAPVLRRLSSKCAHLPARLFFLPGRPGHPQLPAVKSATCGTGFGSTCMRMLASGGCRKRSLPAPCCSPLKIWPAPPAPHAACTLGKTCLTCGTSTVPGLVTCQGVRLMHQFAAACHLTICAHAGPPLVLPACACQRCVAAQAAG